MVNYCLKAKQNNRMLYEFIASFLLKTVLSSNKYEINLLNVILLTDKDQQWAMIECNNDG